LIEWIHGKEENSELIWGCILASLVAKKANFKAYKEKKLAVNCIDMFDKIGSSLESFIKIE